MRRIAFVLPLLLSAFAFASPHDEVASLRQEIAALKLDRALNLSAQQARTLLPLLKQQAVTVQQMKAQREQSKPALVAALTKARDELRATGQVSAATQDSIRQARGGGMMAGHGQFKQFREQVKQILSPQQLEAVKSVRLEAVEMPAGMRGGMARAPEMEGGFGGGWGEPERGAAAEGAGLGGRGHFMKGMFLHHVATSDAFIALVEARAR